MRRLLRAIPLAALLAVAVPQAASAAPCGVAPSGYDRGGAPRSGAPNDPLFSHQWGLQQIKAPGAWARGARGRGVTVAIIDTGVDLGHPDLKAKLLKGKDFVRNVDGLSGPGCPGPQDENGHGTHVAGIAAAITGNGRGVAGTAPAARILPLRALDRSGSGEPEAVDSAIRWAADHGAKVINLSLGGELPLLDRVGDSTGDEKAVAHAFAKGAVVVASAGNSTAPVCDYPAAARRAVCVAATDRNRLPAAYSNFPGDPGGSVAVRAPGGSATSFAFCESDDDIWSTVWPRADIDCGGIRGYDTISGTSMATPFVSGLAALLAGRGLGPAKILQCLKTTSSNHGSYDRVNGYGVVNANAAVASCRKSSR